MTVAAAYVNEKHKEFAKFCNSLRCPLCGAQLDGLINRYKSDLYCVNDNREYKVTYQSGIDDPIDEQITYWYTQYEYIVRAQRWNNAFITTITRYNSEMVGYHKTNSAKVVFKYNGDRIPFFRKRMDEDVFLEKLKTYQLFS